MNRLSFYPIINKLFLCRFVMLPQVMKNHAILELFQKPDPIAARDSGPPRRDSDRGGSRGFGSERSFGGRSGVNLFYLLKPSTVPLSKTNETTFVEE